MKNKDLDTIWIEIETRRDVEYKVVQQMVYVDSLYRAYIGISCIPAKRFVSVEIPENTADQFDSFMVPRGFTLEVKEPSVKHEGYSACVLQATSSEQNDVFTIVAKDILLELNRQKSAELYVGVLKQRIEKWRNFFKTPSRKKISDDLVVGLIGELTFVRDLAKNGIANGIDFWNGPIRSAQDFQRDDVAVEVKTSVSNKLDCVNISSEVQLDDGGREALFLVVYRAERNDANGVKLPELIRIVADGLTERQKKGSMQAFCVWDILMKMPKYIQRAIL